MSFLLVAVISTLGHVAHRDISGHEYGIYVASRGPGGMQCTGGPEDLLAAIAGMANPSAGRSLDACTRGDPDRRPAQKVQPDLAFSPTVKMVI